MGILRHLFLVCTIWCILDQVHSIPSHKTEGSSLSQPLVAKRPLEGGHKEVCGKSKKIKADKLSIVGGDEAMLGDWPWMVALFQGTPIKPASDHCYCAGSLISKEWVVTAAHCVQRTKEEKIFARLGDLDLDDRVKDGASPIDVRIDKIVPHPGYTSSPMSNDIALIHLKTPVHFTEQKVSTRLLETTISMVPKEKCAEQYSNMTDDFMIDERVICAADIGKDTCQGDSGGPLVFLNTINEEQRFYLGGITSGGYKCALKDYSGVYTKVAQFACWISDVTGEDF